MSSELASLLRVARRLGRDSRLVQGGGGNVSLKRGAEMSVKASGAALKHLKAEGFVSLDFERIRSALWEGRLADDAAYRSLLAASQKGAGRPSIESALHALLGPLVIHTHPNAVLRTLCRKNARTMSERLERELAVPLLFVPYASPGLPLAEALIAEARRHKTDLTKTPLVVLLANHGLFVSAQSASEAAELHSRVLAACEASCPLPPYPAPLPSIDPALKRRFFAWSKARGAWCAPRRLALKAALPLLAASTDSALAACFPDQVVYLGPSPLTLSGDEPRAWDAAWQAYVEDWGQEPLVLLHRAGLLFYSNGGSLLNAAREESLMTFCEVLCGQQRDLARLTRAQCLHLMNWESERFRSAALAKGARAAAR